MIKIIDRKILSLIRGNIQLPCQLSSEKVLQYRLTMLELRAQTRKKQHHHLCQPPPIYRERKHQFDSTPSNPQIPPLTIYRQRTSIRFNRLDPRSAQKKKCFTCIPPPPSPIPPPHHHPRLSRRLHPEIEEEGLEPFQHFRANRHNEICVRGRTGLVNRRFVG